MSTAALNEASNFAFCTSLPVFADGIGQAPPETGFYRRIPIIPRSRRADVGREVLVMGCVTHVSFLVCGKRNAARRQERRALSPQQRASMLASRRLRGLRCDRLVPGAVLLLIEGLAVEGARRGGRAGQDGQSEKCGQKGLHDRSP